MATDVLDLYAKINFDSTEFNKGLADAESSMSKVGDTIKAGLGMVTKVAAGAVAAGAAAVGKIVSDSVSAYGSYEQLVGGVQTLFGENAQQVLENSEKAYRTAGMSMNEYMETSIQSAAALINSLEGDTKTAAELMDMSITDMSDNVNKMGTTMEAVQNAYRGFSRGNFTMLDNLALGFSGTKAGMEELLEKAEQLSGIHYDIESYSDIVKAIHVVQQEMGITGTTAAEAADTIQGSAGSMKAAWENLKVELTKEDGDIGQSIEILLNSALTMYDNLEPKIERALGGMSEFVAQAAPLVAEKLPPIIEKIVPSLLSSSATLVYSVGKGIAAALPSLLGSVGNLATGAYNSFAKADLGAFDWIREDIVHVVNSVKDTTGNLDLSTLFDSVKGNGESLNGWWERVGDGFTWLVDNVFNPLAEWDVNDALPHVFDILSSSLDILGNTIDFIKPGAEWLWNNFLQPLGELTLDTVSFGLEKVSGWLSAIAETFSDVDWKGWWNDFDNFGVNWSNGWEEILGNIEEVGEGVDEFFDTNDWSRAWNKFWQGVGEKIFDVQNNVINPFIDNWKVGWSGLKDAWTEFKDNFALGCDVIREKIEVVTNVYYTLKTAVEQVTGKIEQFDAVSEATNAVGKGFISGTLNRIFGKNHAAGFLITKPVVDAYGDRYGEAGREALVPLDSNTGWIDELADKLSRKGGSGMVVQNLNLTVEGGRIADDYDTDRFIERVAEKLGALSVRQSRAVGGTGWNY